MNNNFSNEIDFPIIKNMMEKLENSQNHKDALAHLFEGVSTGQLESIRGVIFKSGEYIIQNLLTNYGMVYENNLKKLNSFDLNIVPKHIKTIIKDRDMFIVSKIEGTKTGFIEPLYLAKSKVTKEAKLIAYQDLQKLTKKGFTDNKVLKSTAAWFVTPDDMQIIIPSWEALRPVLPHEVSSILTKYHQILFD